MWGVEGANFWVKIVGLVIVSRLDCQRPILAGARVAKAGCKWVKNIDRPCPTRCKWGRSVDGIYSIMERLKVKSFDQITSSTCHIYWWLFDQMIMKYTWVNLVFRLS